MDRQQAKELLPIIQAFAEGKIIQSRRINGMWIDLEMKTALNIISLINEPQKYRIKPKPKYRPFNDAEECWQEMLKHQPFGWTKSISGNASISYQKLMIMTASFQIMTMFHSKLFLHQTRLLTEHHSV